MHLTFVILEKSTRAAAEPVALTAKREGVKKL